MQKLIITILLFTSIVRLNGQDYFNFELKDHKCFKPGEKMIYSIKFGPISAGTATITLKKELYQKQIAYHARIFAKTTGLADKIYKVRDTYESYIDINSMKPLMAVQNLEEGDYRFHTEMHFNHENNTVYSMKSDSIFSVPEAAVDMVTLLYYIRSLNLEKIRKGQKIDINIFFDEEVLPFDFRYRGLETVRTANGTYRCHRFDPVVIVGREFKSEDDMSVFLTSDGNYIPVRVKFDLKIGSIKCDLMESYNNKFPVKTNL